MLTTYEFQHPSNCGPFRFYPRPTGTYATFYQYDPANTIWNLEFISSQQPSAVTEGFVEATVQ